MLTGQLPALIDHRKMVNQATTLSGHVPLDELSRLGEMLEKTSGNVQVSLTFHRGNGRQTCIDGEVSTTVSQICQHCMVEFEKLIACEIHLEIVPVERPEDPERSEAQENDRDLVVFADKLIPLPELIEDDLILAMPMVPRHEGPCPDGDYTLNTSEQPEPDQPVETHRPFADLARAMNEHNKLES